MDYKKEYEAMVQRARELHKGGNALTKQQMEIVCPELAESEDKRVNEEIRNFLIDMECKREWIAYLEKQKINTEGDFARGYDCGYQCCLNSHGAEWFEKQKEQKPDTRDADDLQLLGFIYDLLNEIKWKDSWAMSKEECLRRLNDYRPQKPAEWSEEDERIRGHIIGVLTYYAENHSALTVAFINRDIDWLKSLPMGCPKKEEKEIDLDGEITKYWKDISSLYGPVGKEITRFDFEDV